MGTDSSQSLSVEIEALEKRIQVERRQAADMARSLRLELRDGIFSSKTLLVVFAGAAVIGVIAGARLKTRPAKRQRSLTRH
jgi:hypothetical protein